ncbi:hypothetical protein ACFQ5N_01895 [Lutibacter holmesii]|uniref:Uncharacterized protein n=1 Tax=Lutibacter holmesii TaxID=1137985 RepID=A0ABW3WKI0_9FLAO
MRAKQKKDWYGREKSIEELHDDARNWISEIDFITDEIRFLERLLSYNYINCKEAGLLEEIQKVIKKITAEKKVGITAKEVIQEQERILSNLIKTNAASQNENYFDTHQKLEAEIRFYIHKYKNIKKEIFTIIETILKKKDQKKLV